MNASLTSLIRSELLHWEGVRRLPPARRFTSLLTSETAPESLFFLDSGYVKITRRGEDSKEVIISIITPGELFGEHALLHKVQRPFTAEILQEGMIHEIPRDVFLQFTERHPEVWQMLWELALHRQADAEQKISLLCLQDVEYRILHYLSHLAHLFGTPATDTESYSLPLSQSELASLIGATRETTSTTLNSLSRTGLLHLGRRLVTVKSMEALRMATRSHLTKGAAPSTSSAQAQTAG